MGEQCRRKKATAAKAPNLTAKLKLANTKTFSLYNLMNHILSACKYLYLRFCFNKMMDEL